MGCGVDAEFEFYSRGRQARFAIAETYNNYMNAPEAKQDRMGTKIKCIIIIKMCVVVRF